MNNAIKFKKSAYLTLFLKGTNYANFHLHRFIYLYI